MDAFELLKTDHKKVADLFKQIENGSGSPKAQLFAQLKSELDVHAHVEEVIFYPALENKEQSREITLEAYEEHKVVKDLLAELANGSPNEEWDAKLTVLKENVEHHVEEEEGELFSKARKVLSDEQIETLGNEMEAEKARQNGGAPPAKRRTATASRSIPSAATSKAKSKTKPGVLKRLANLVGLGGSAAETKRSRKAGKAAKAKTGGKAATKAGARKSASKARSSKGSKKAMSKKGASKTTKSASKSGSKKSRSGTKKARGAKKR